MPPTSADRNLLFGIIALQMDFIARDQLIAAMHGWVLHKTKPLGDLLVAQGALSQRHRDLLEPMVDARVEQHLGDAAMSLASVTAGRSPHDALAAIDDADVQASLRHVTIQPDDGDPLATKSWAAEGATHTWSVGESTSDGMRFRVLRQHAKGGLGIVYAPKARVCLCIPCAAMNPRC